MISTECVQLLHHPKVKTTVSQNIKSRTVLASKMSLKLFNFSLFSGRVWLILVLLLKCLEELTGEAIVTTPEFSKCFRGKTDQAFLFLLIPQFRSQHNLSKIVLIFHSSQRVSQQVLSPGRNMNRSPWKQSIPQSFRSSSLSQLSDPLKCGVW